MLLKALILACILALATCQSVSSCDSTSFYFYNGYGISEGFAEQYWDWQGYDFSDGTSDTFDDYFYLDLIIDNAIYSSDNFYNSPVDYYCDVGTTDFNSTSYASYTYNITDTIQLVREFYAPRSTVWLRVFDTVHNFGTSAVNISMRYYGEYGSDSDTTFAVVNDYYWVSSDGDNGNSDPPFTVNAAGSGAQIIPTKTSGFNEGNDVTSFTYNSISIPAGESRAIMIVLGQHGNLSNALDGASQINLLPEYIYTNLSKLANVVNWNFCGATIEAVDPKTTYCSTPISITFTVSEDIPISFNSNPVTVSNKQFTVNVVNGNNQISYQRQVGDCPARTASFDFKLPPANFSVSVDNSGTFPKVNATGGYGTYDYTWKFSSGGDLTTAFGGKATVTVTDMEGCAASAQIDVPKLPSIPSTPAKVSSASQIIASFVGLIALAIAL